MAPFGLLLRVTHTGQAAESIHISDVRDGIDLLGGAYGFRKSGPIYVPTPANGGQSLLVYSGDVAVSFETGGIRKFIEGGYLTAEFVAGSDFAILIGSPDHDSLNNLEWIVSGHTGPNTGEGSIPLFDGAGAATVLSGVDQGDLLYYDGSTWAILSPGVPGQTLTTAGAGANPTWSTPAGGGNVIGPGSGSSTDNALVRWDGTTGTAIQDSLGWLLGDTGLLDGSSGNLILPQAASPSPTVEGQVIWDSAGDHLTIGDGAGTVTLIDDGTAATGDVSGNYPGPLSVTDFTIAGEVQGSILYFDGTNWVQLPPGTSGQVLTTNGGGADPSWQASSGGSAALLFGANSVGASTTTRYLYPSFDGGLAQTAVIQFRAPRAGTLRNLRVQVRAGAGNGNTIVYTLRVNGAASALTASLASTGTSTSDLVNTVAVAAGDLLDLEVTKGAAVGTSPTDIVTSVEFV